MPPSKDDPFYESQEDHSLIGVANIFLEALFYDVKLEYHVPIISQQGEVSHFSAQISSFFIRVTDTRSLKTLVPETFQL